MSNNTLLVFVRNPIPGKVKTRLAATVGPEAALRIYLELLRRTRTAAKALPARRVVCYSDFVPDNDEWETDFFEKRSQCGADLGARMYEAFEYAFATGATRVVIIGSDCPELQPALLQQAFDLLGQHDFVIGPAPDGGYYLLGMKAPEAALFQHMIWSTETVRTETEMRIRALGKTLAHLPELRDVDTEADLPPDLR